MTRRDLATGKALLRVPQTCTAVDAACADALALVLAAATKCGLSRTPCRRFEAIVSGALTDGLAGVLKAQTAALREALIDEIEKGIPE